MKRVVEIGKRQIRPARVATGWCCWCALVAICSAGCTRAPYAPPPRPAEYPDEEYIVPEKKILPALRKSKEASAKSLADKHVEQGDGPSDAQPDEPKPEFPPDAAHWSSAHFQLAWQKRNPRLRQAVRELGVGNTLNPDPVANALLLAKLLEPLPPPPVNPNKKPVSRGYDDFDPPADEQVSQIPGLPQAIVEALGANGSTEARAALKRILLGNVRSDADDRSLTFAALKTLVEHLDEENQRIVLAVLTVPDSIRPPGRGQLTADQLHEECLRLARPVATADFRLRLAQRAARGVSSVASRQRLYGLLMNSDRANLPAQVELLVSGQVEPTALATLDRQIGQAGQQLLDRLLRATPREWAEKNAAAPATQVGYDDEVVPRGQPFSDIVQTARQLWRPDFAQALAVRIEAAEDLPSEATLVALATCLPSDTVRTALAKRWKKLWVEDSGVAQGPTLYSGGARDPGLVVVLKQLPREAPTFRGRANPVARPNINATQAQRTKEQTARQAWLRASQNFVRSLADRLASVAEIQAREAGLATGVAVAPVGSVDDFDKLLETKDTAKPQPIASKSPAVEPLPAELGLSLPKGARIRAVCHLNWPTDFQGRLEESSAGPLVAHFVRLEAEGDLESMAASFEKQLKKSAVVRTIDDGRWVDALVKVDGGRARSVDVWMTRADSETPSPKGTSEKLVVEIMSIEVTDPQPSTSESR